MLEPTGSMQMDVEVYIHVRCFESLQVPIFMLTQLCAHVEVSTGLFESLHLYTDLDTAVSCRFVLRLSEAVIEADAGSFGKPALVGDLSGSLHRCEWMPAQVQVDASTGAENAFAGRNECLHRCKGTPAQVLSMPTQM